MNFSEIIGQDDIKALMKAAIKNKKISHAYIINGEEGAGKMMLAEAFAATLLCAAEGEDACGQCKSCAQAANRNNPDIIYVTHEKEAISVDDIREQINDTIVIKPYSSKHKIYIVDDAQKMNVQAMNALLKTIEEPPSYGVIILLTTNADKFLPTILSRCVQIDMKPIKDEQIISYLRKKYDVVDYQAQVCAAFSQGNLGKAISLIGSEDFNLIKERVLKLVKRLESYDSYNIDMTIKELSDMREKTSDFLELLTLWYRDVLLYKSTLSDEKLIFQDEVFTIKEQALKFSYEGIEEILKTIKEATARLNSNVNYELTLEMMFLKMQSGQRR